MPAKAAVSPLRPPTAERWRAMTHAERERFFRSISEPLPPLVAPSAEAWQAMTPKERDRFLSGGDVPLPEIVALGAELWEAMTPEERQRFQVEVNAALEDPRAVMGETRRHKQAKSRAIDVLGLHFRTVGRVVYLAEEMVVHYPDEPVFTPDVLAVVGVPQPEDDERVAWDVKAEGRGLDLVIEVLHRGDRRKDLVRNVERYARLGIPEYFVYDRARQRVHGHRLPEPSAGLYQPILPQLGRYHSRVLDVDLGIEGGTLRFYHGMAELFGSEELIGRLGNIMRDLEAKAEQADTAAEQARADAEQAVAGMREAVLALLGARGITCPEELRVRVQACEDPEVLRRWLGRAITATSAAEVLG